MMHATPSLRSSFPESAIRFPSSLTTIILTPKQKLEYESFAPFPLKNVSRNLNVVYLATNSKLHNKLSSNSSFSLCTSSLSEEVVNRSSDRRLAFGWGTSRVLDGWGYVGWAGCMEERRPGKFQGSWGEQARRWWNFWT
jgi:hypothetical protein